MILKDKVIRKATEKELEQFIADKENMGDMVFMYGNDVHAFGNCKAVAKANGNACTYGAGDATAKGSGDATAHEDGDAITEGHGDAEAEGNGSAMANGRGNAISYGNGNALTYGNLTILQSLPERISRRSYYHTKR